MNNDELFLAGTLAMTAPLLCEKEIHYFVTFDKNKFSERKKAHL